MVLDLGWFCLPPPLIFIIVWRLFLIVMTWARMCVCWGGRGWCHWHLVGRSQRLMPKNLWCTRQYPTTKHDLVQNVNSANFSMVEKSWSKQKCLQAYPAESTRGPSLLSLCGIMAESRLRNHSKAPDGSFYMPNWLGHRMPRYLIKHYSKYVCEDLWTKFTLESVDWI